MLQSARIFQLLVSGRIFQLITLLLVVLLAYLGQWLVQRKHVINVRPLPQIEALKEMAARCAETGRPVTFVPGGSGTAGIVSASLGSATIASLSIMTHVAYHCGLTGAKPIVLAAVPAFVPLYESALKAGFEKAGRPEAYTDDMVRYSTPELYSYAAWCAGSIRRENAGANMIIGSQLMDAIIEAMAGLDVGAMQIAGPGFSYFFVATCDYVFIGPELYAGTAYLTGEPVLLGSIRGQDHITLLNIALILVGVVLAAAKSDLLLNLFRW